MPFKANKIQGWVVNLRKQDDMRMLNEDTKSDVIFPGGMAQGVMELIDCARMSPVDFDAAIVPEYEKRSAERICLAFEAAS